MINQVEGTCIVIHPDTAPTTLRVIGDVRVVLRASCSWKLSPSAGAEAGSIAAIRLPDGCMRFGLGAAAFGPFPELAVQRLGECVLLEGVPWWTPAERMSASRREDKGAELLTPFLIEWDTMNSAWGWLDSASTLSLLKWYEGLLSHPVIGRTGAIAVEIVAQIPAGMIVDKYMCRAPLAHNNTLARGQLITDPDLIDVYFLRNAVWHTTVALVWEEGRGSTR